MNIKKQQNLTLQTGENIKDTENFFYVENADYNGLTSENTLLKN